MINNMAPIIQVDKISFHYPDGQLIFSDLSFQVYPHQRTVLIGPNGAGKSTLLFILLRLHEPTEGGIYFHGDKLKNIPEAILRQRMAYIFQNPDDQVFAPTVEEDILFGPVQFNYSKEETYKKLAEIAETLQITHLLKRNPRHLSYGEKRRVALAGVLVLNPEIIFFDEPLAFLDPKGRELLLQILAQLEVQGKTLFIVTHDLNFAGEWGERFLVMAKGQLCADGGREVLQQGIGVFNHLRPLSAELFTEFLPPMKLPINIEEGKQILKKNFRL